MTIEGYRKVTIVQYARPRLAHTTTPARIAALGPGEFEGYASLFNVADGAGDIVAPGAFTRSLRRRPPARVRMLYQHFAHEPIGVWDEIREDVRGLYVRGRLIEDVERARDVAALIAKGALNGLSIGFRTLRARRDAAGGTRTLLEIELWEISVVTFPLLAGSEVTAIGKKSAAANALGRAAAVFRSATTVIPGEPRSGEGRGPRPIRASAAPPPGSPSLASLRDARRG
ncbi:MAG TPA: HK97 family phage prohead protease [Rhizomicrobium sp.]